MYGVVNECEGEDDGEWVVGWIWEGWRERDGMYRAVLCGGGYRNETGW